jgi:hypothetical protein
VVNHEQVTLRHVRERGVRRDGTDRTFGYRRWLSFGSGSATPLSRTRPEVRLRPEALRRRLTTALPFRCRSTGSELRDAINDAKLTTSRRDAAIGDL